MSPWTRPTSAERVVEVPAGTTWRFPSVCVRCLEPASAHVDLSVSTHHERGTFWGIQVADVHTGPLPRVPYCAEHRNAIVGPQRAASRDWGIAAGFILVVSLLVLVTGLMDEDDGANLGDRLGSAIFAAMAGALVIGLVVLGICWLVRRVRHSSEWMADYRRALKGDQTEGTYHPGVDAEIILDDSSGTLRMAALELTFEEPAYATRFARENGLATTS